MRRLLEDVALRAGLEAAAEQAPLAVGGEDEHGRRPAAFSVRSLVASSPSIPGMRTSMITTFGRRRSATATAPAPSDASPTTRMCGGAREREPESLADDFVVVGDQAGDLVAAVCQLPRSRIIVGQDCRRNFRLVVAGGCKPTAFAILAGGLDELPPSTHAPESGRGAVSDSLRIVVVLAPRAGECRLRRGRVRARDGPPGAARGAREARQPAGRGRRFGSWTSPCASSARCRSGSPIFGILLGARRRGRCSPDYFDAPGLGDARVPHRVRILTYLSVVLGELVPKAIALERAERLAVCARRPARLARPAARTRSSGCSTSSAQAVARLFGVPPAPARASTAHTEEDIRSIVAEAGGSGAIERPEEEMVYKVFDFADKEAHEVMVPAAAGGRALGRPPAAGGARRRDRLALHALPGLSRVARRRARASSTFATSSRRSTTAASTTSRSRTSSGPPTSCPRRRTWPRCSRSSARQNQHMAHRRRRVRRGRRHRHARGPARGDRGRDRGRVRPSGRVGRARRRPHDPHRRHVPDRRLQRAVRPGAAGQEDYHTVAGFVFGQLGRAADTGDEVEWDGLRFAVVETDGPAHRPPRGRVSALCGGRATALDGRALGIPCPDLRSARSRDTPVTHARALPA